MSDPAFMVSGSIKRKGLAKIPVITITDGVNTWTFDVAESFTIPELKRRFPHFFAPATQAKGGKNDG